MIIHNMVIVKVGIYWGEFLSFQGGIGSTRIRVRQLTSQAITGFFVSIPYLGFRYFKKLKNLIVFLIVFPLTLLVKGILFMVPSSLHRKFPTGEEVSFLCLYLNVPQAAFVW